MVVGSVTVSTALSAGTYVSSNGGDTWVLRSNAGAVRAAMSDDGRSVMLTTRAGALYAHQSLIDGSVDWTLERVNTEERLAMSADGRYRLRSAMAGMLASADHGAPWAPVAPGVPVGAVPACSLDCGRVYASRASELYISRVTTMPGTTGGLAGGAGSSVELQYLGGGTWNVIGHGGSVSAH
jgi:hypothetical protein